MIEGLNKALNIIRKEKKIAIKLNPQMAMGMGQVEKLIIDEINKIEKGDK